MDYDWTFDIPTLVALASIFIVLLVFLIEQYQMRKQMLVQNFSEYTKRYQEILLQLPLSIFDDNFDLVKVPDDEREKILKLMRAYFELCAEEYYLSRSRMIDHHIWEDWREGMEYTFNRPAFKEAWKEVSRHKDIYKEFRPFHDRTTAENKVTEET